jgi:hypothetical protein
MAVRRTVRGYPFDGVAKDIPESSVFFICHMPSVMCWVPLLACPAVAPGPNP